MTLLCFVTCKNSAEARRIASALLEKRLVACANLVPSIESHYRWKGKLEKAEEGLLILKTKRELQNKVEEEIKKLHSYELPVIEFVEANVGKAVQEWTEGETE
jgi:periplasmic divalent cation tolerance protein